ncbi:unnamed protein product [Xylocopa violacea]|uniref:Uncharacterized protein n=1 Tax=Xylocopa violacea TaxID=135666 RepID=A0ABP1NK74_XYLVO
MVLNNRSARSEGKRMHNAESVATQDPLSCRMTARGESSARGRRWESRENRREDKGSQHSNRKTASKRTVERFWCCCRWCCSLLLLPLLTTGPSAVRRAWKEKSSGRRETRKLVRARARAFARLLACPHVTPRVCVNEIGNEHDSKRGESRIDRVARGWSNRRPTGWSVFYTGARVASRE